MIRVGLAETGNSVGERCVGFKDGSAVGSRVPSVEAQMSRPKLNVLWAGTSVDIATFIYGIERNPVISETMKPGEESAITLRISLITRVLMGISSLKVDPGYVKSLDASLTKF